MWKVLLIVFLLLLVVLHWRTREHLEAGGTILVPEGEEDRGLKMYTREQQRANWMILPIPIREFMKVKYAGEAGPGATDARIEDTAMKWSSVIIAKFYHRVYKPSQTPITMDDIRGFTAGNALDAPEYADMLTFYFIDQAPRTPTGPPAALIIAPGPSPPPQPPADTPSPTPTLPQPLSNAPPTTSTPQPVPSTLDVSGPSTITINIR